MIERDIRAEASVPIPEILRQDSFTGLYSRVLLASNNEKSGMAFINPGEIIKSKPVTIKKPEGRSYTHVTRGLSSFERIEAWKGIEFGQAYAQWKEGFTTTVRILEKERAEILGRLVLGKQANEFGGEDTDLLYEKYCKGQSNTDKYIKTIIKNLRQNGKIDIQSARTSIGHLEWFSGMLFGKQTAEAISRMIELEVDIQNNGTVKVRDSLFSNKERLNEPNLNDTEVRILTGLKDGKRPIPAETRARPADTAVEKSEESVDKIKQEMESLSEKFEGDGKFAEELSNFLLILKGQDFEPAGIQELIRLFEQKIEKYKSDAKEKKEKRSKKGQIAYRLITLKNEYKSLIKDNILPIADAIFNGANIDPDNPVLGSIEKTFMDILNNFGIQRMDSTIGKDYDELTMIGLIKGQGVKGKVKVEVRPGFLFNGELLCPAEVTLDVEPKVQPAPIQFQDDKHE